MSFIVNWLIAALAIIIAAYVLPGVSVAGFTAALITALALGLINALIKPVLTALTLPLNVATLGLFSFVINALLIMFASAVIPGFVVNGFWWALLFSLVLALVNYAFSEIRDEPEVSAF
jgi:putative membrane protein